MKQTHLTKTILCISTYLITVSCFAQSNIVQEIDRINTFNVALQPLRFLASDELMGRATARPEINIAARYTSENFRTFGLKECAGTIDYFQSFTIKMVTPATTGTLTIDNHSYSIGTDFLQINGADTQVTAPVVYARFGSKEDLDKLDIKGKIVITNMGASDSSSFMQGYHLIKTKQQLIVEHGGIALIERFKPGDRPWTLLQQRYTSERPVSDDAVNLETFIIKDTTAVLPALLQNKSANATLKVANTIIKTIAAKNVMGWVEGTDAKLKDQFIVLSAHYDHLGVAKQPKMEEGKLDSVYNGARDNAVGTTAVVDAARYFGQHPAKRSILFIAYTGEEIGELGSKYFASHPVVPLKHIVYNLNIDNGGYDDTSAITLIGLGRTSADDDIKKAVVAFGMKLLGDPAPEQDFFDRSDNVNLAEKGIPAPTFGLGVDKLDDEVMKRYHQLSDEVGNFDLTYAVKYIHSFILAAQNIADDDKQPTWTKGDKYEAAWKQLYYLEHSFGQ